jgi:hypothetical protein
MREILHSQRRPVDSTSRKVTVIGDRGRRCRKPRFTCGWLDAGLPPKTDGTQLRHPIVYTAGVKKSPTEPVGVLLIAVALSLVLFLLIPHDVQQHGVIVFPFALVPIFLFGLIVLNEVSDFWLSAIYLPLDPANSRSLLFQLPPPLNS